MDQILLKLFEAFNGDQVSPEEKAVWERVGPCIQEIEAKLSLEECGALWSAAMSVGAAEAEASFVRGFRLGARLMLEALG